MQIHLLVFVFKNTEDKNYAKHDGVRQNLPLMPDIKLSIQSRNTTLGAAL